MNFSRSIINGKLISFDKENFQEFGNLSKVYGAESSGQYDLEVGIVNLTDDGDNLNGFYSDRILMVAKHQTARLKPFNIQHQSRNIIGVMYDTALADQDNKILEIGKDILIDEKTAELSFDENIKTLRILAACALYKLVAPEEVDEIVEKVKQGEDVAVSLEAWYQGWDYIFKDVASGKVTKIEKTEKNSYLDEYINKELNGKKVCRLPKQENFIYGGIGQVTKGACPNSIFVAVACDLHSKDVVGESAFNETGLLLIKEAASKIESSDKSQEPGERTTMAEETKPSQAAASTPESGNLPTQVLATQLQSISEQSGALKQQVETKTKENSELSEKIQNLEKSAAEVSETHKNEKAELEKKIADLEKVNRGLANYVYLVENYADVKFEGSPKELAASLESFDEGKLKEFAEKKKGDMEKKADEEKKLMKKAKCELLKLDPEKATDEEINKAVASLEEGLKEPPKIGSQHRIGAPTDTPTKEVAGHTEDTSENEVPVIVMRDRDTGKTTKL